MAKKEVYRLGINIKVDGDKQSKKVLTEVEKSTEKVKKKVRDLDKLTASPSAKLKDTASTAIDKIKSKTEKLNNKTATAKLKAKDEASKTINKVQNKLNSWIKTGAKKVISIGLAGAVALGGLGIGSAIKTFSEFEQGLSNVKAVTQATDTEMKVLKDTAKSLGASTAWSAVQVTQAEELLGQAGFSVKETTSALPGLLSLASAGGLDLAAATDIASGTLRAFNIDASQTSHVADVLALSASATNSDVTDLGETMKYAAPVAQALGISFEDTAAASGLLSNANIKGSQAGTVLRQTMARLASPTKEAAKVMKAYGINAFDAQGNMKPLNGVINNLNSSLGKLTSQKRADIISTVFGTESMSGVLALMNQGGQSLGDLSKKLTETKGAADEMAKTKLDNLAGQWTILKSAVEGMKIELGEKLAPYAKQFVTWFTAKVPSITDSVVKFVDTISNNIGTIKTAGGAFLGLTGAFVGMSAINKISTTVGTFGKLLGGFKTTATADALVKTTGAMQGLGLASKIIPALLSPAGLAIGALGITGLVAAKQLSKEVVPAVDLFADKVEYLKDSTKVSGMGGMSQEITKISTATKEAVGAYMEMDNSVQRTLLNLRYKNTTITSDIANDVIEQFTNMNKTITNKLDENLKSDSSKIQAMFNNNTKLTAEEQTSIMTQLENHYNKQKTTTENALKEISSIWKEASQENRATNEEENNRINELRSQMTATAITNLSETEKESAIILGRIKDQTGRITAETAADIVQKLNEQRQQTVDAANAEYAARVNIAEQIRAEGGQKAEETANKMINEAARQRDETIAAADATRSQGIDMLKQAYGDLETSVDINTGQILTFWGRLKQWWDNTTFGTKFAEIQTNGVVGMVGQNPNNSSSKITKPASEIETDLVGAPNSLSRQTIKWGKQNYTGTNNAMPGINSVGERGMELVLGRSLYDFKGGEKVLNNGETKSILNNLGQAPVYAPQQGSGGGNSFSFDFGDINVNQSNDISQIVKEATYQFASQFKEVLTNIKK
ncbi:phage tail tape measure protein [Clostridium botulinum]|uniref:Phage tail tape measure protein n=1 Tax=Clostridium botulinum TaxID=1491 RepID=A0A6B4JNP3_CLOBO|nr:phage tail tape measure protein [Clostridium botulinum]EES48845.1 phage tail tape measure protein, TP901 family [Clostridium botulinum E1 str. 'BoNT E Beluga']MBY6761859.1 phage tail tape measure protein [Clostridium botulinum]MBY6920785.1 phage tail tape measure protein [Clostridium botulinum]MCR1131466.1 phage tail tape measure protein [Clostridium botulinum]NFJ58628.1 phage tail tape measure protein [Clostridium botulinum]